MKLYPSEWNVMNLLWEKGAMRASDIAKELAAVTGWSRNTTYTVIKKCVDKGAIKRSDPHFMCEANVAKEDIVAEDAIDIVENRYEGSITHFVTAFARGHKLTESDIEELRNLIDHYKA